MGREVRKVPKDWEHPKGRDGHYIPLKDGYRIDFEGFKEKIEEDGLEEALEYYGGGPVKYDYMLPDTPDELRTHYMMYEDTSEGTPKSPAFEKPEDLAQWLVDNKVSRFGNMTGSYEDWMYVINGGFGGAFIQVSDEGANWAFS